jgi:UDPglucose 6-dehydrogenase
VQAVEDVNDRQKSVLFDKVVAHFDGDLKGKHFALWGLAFKPKTDDMREAPSLVIIDKLLEQGATVTAFDPEAMEEAKRRIGDKVGYANPAMGALEGADALILVTEWSEFRHVDPSEIKRQAEGPVFFDGRNIFEAARMREAGLTYYGIGIR